ncbi:type II toxin-antitoxin system VapC family toxin [soil metagenome]
MTGIDTNVLARYIVQDDVEQTPTATAFVEHHCTVQAPGWISCIVLSEFAWLLAKGYKYAKADIVEVLKLLLSTKQLRVESEMQAWLALRDYQQGSADYPDYLIAYRNRQHGCTQTVTFDRKAAKHQLFEMLM